MRYVTIVVMSAALLLGCSRKPTDPEREKTDELSMNIRTLIREGQTNEALRVLSEAVTDEAYGRYRPRILRGRMELLLDVGRIDTAKEEFLAACEKSDPEFRKAVFGSIHMHHMRTKDYEKDLAWCRRLLQLDWDPREEARAFVWFLEDLTGLDQYDQVVEAVPESVERFDDRTRQRIWQQMLTSYMQNGKADIVARIVEKLAAIPKEPYVAELVALWKVKLPLADKNWEKLAEVFRAGADDIQDRPLAQILRAVVVAAKEDGHMAEAENLCGFVLEEQTDKKEAREEASAHWLALLKEEGKTGHIAEGYRQLLQWKLSPKFLLSLYPGDFYFLLENGTPEQVLDIMDFGRRLADEFLDDQDVASRILSMEVDAYFLMEKYEEALKLLEKGLPQRDEKWHNMAINKVKAHMALRDGRKKEAVQYFRKFMQDVADGFDDQRDPTSGLLYTKEMMLGQNAARIARILESMGDNKGAQEAYNEAVSYYQEALDKLKKDTDAYRQAEEALKKIEISKKSAAL